MKVVHLSYKDYQEGAAIAANRICDSLIMNGVDSQMLVQKKILDKPYSFASATNNFPKIFPLLRVGLDMLFNSLLVKDKSSYFTFPFIGTDISNHKLLINADIIHIHWINRGFLNLESIKRILKLQKPTVWTLHDSWPFSGGCHMTGQCVKYQDDCHACELSPHFQLASLYLKKKRKLFSNTDINFLAPSSWIAEKAGCSAILREKTIAIIPNCVDMSIFKPIDSEVARTVFNLPLGKPILLFNVTNDKRKGVEYLQEAISLLSGKDEGWIFVGFGASDIANTAFRGLPVITVGRINDPHSMAILYSACDVMIAPAIEEPFGQTYIEAMACGTPCVSFNCSGPIDIIDHKINGYLASFANTEDLIEGVRFCFFSNKEMSVAAIEKIKHNFSFEVVSKLHIAYYNSLLEH